MAQRNDWILLTTGLARLEGENAMYSRASDKLPLEEKLKLAANLGADIVIDALVLEP